MIEQFAIINERGNFAEVEFDSIGNIELTYEQRKEVLYGGKIQGISWRHNNKQVKLLNESFNISGLPLLEQNVVIVLYHERQNGYPLPKDVEILNQDGSVKQIVKLPTLISPIADKYYRRTKYPTAMFFGAVRLEKINSNTRLVFNIGFNRDWYEDRVYDITTGEFGECIGSGRV